MVRKLATHAARIIWIVVGLIALVLGAIGVALPLLPTTPFVLVAAFAFAKSSERLHNWLVEHDVFGALIRNWREHGAISKRAKTLGILSMIAVLAITWLHEAPFYVIAVQSVVLGTSALFILTRPLPPGE
ncbi:MAG: YbaN family protein [Woeseiaceae bacterium]|nr:YbaN family protein [Woeseiaceae bacterium]